MDDWRTLTACVVSDVHLNSHRRDVPEADPSREDARQSFRQFLLTLRAGLKPHEKLFLVLNGDIFDILGSWRHDAIYPWDGDAGRVEAALAGVLAEILANNRDVAEVLKDLTAQPQVEIVYVIGNHDRLLGVFPSAQALLQAKLGPVQFAGSFESLELALYVEHGHRFDPFNHEDYSQQPPVGDLIVVLIVNRFAALTADKLLEYGYSHDLIDEVRQQLEEAEYLRPISLGPYWLQALARRYEAHPENAGKAQSIPDIIRHVVAGTLLAPEMNRFISSRLRLPPLALKTLLRVLLRYPGLLPWLSIGVSQVLHRTESSRFQAKMAAQIREKTGFHFISFGHTHIPALMPLGEGDFYFNTGCWKPIIHLFRPHRCTPDLMTMLWTGAPLSRIERSGIFKLERDLAHPARPCHFSLVTIQHGSG